MAVPTPPCVFQTTATSGTGTLTLGAAVAGYRTLADAVTAGEVAAGDTVYYRAEADDADGIPTGLWEAGSGVVGAGGLTLSRVAVQAGSSGTVLVDFTVAPWVFVTDPPDVVIDDALVSLVWAAPGAEAGNAIEVAASVQDFAGRTFATGLVDVEVVVTDGAADAEPSATATLSAATSPVGTVLAGSGTATLVIRTDATGALKVRVSETAAGMRYLWVREGGQRRLWVRSSAGVLELTFA